MFELKNYVKNALHWALDAAEKYAEQTDNPLDDVVVKAASSILRRVFSIEEGPNG